MSTSVPGRQEGPADLRKRDLPSFWQERRYGSGGVLRERGSPALEAPQFPLELRPRIALDALILVAREVPQAIVVGRPRAARAFVEFTQLVDVRRGGGHFTSFPRM